MQIYSSSQYMSAMNIEELLNPKGDCLPGLFILNI